MGSAANGFVSVQPRKKSIRTFLAFRTRMMASLLEYHVSQEDDIEIVGEVWDPDDVLPLLDDANADVVVLEAMLLPIGREHVGRPSLGSMGAVVVTMRCLNPPELGLPIERAFRTLAHVAMCEAREAFVEAIRWAARGDPLQLIGSSRIRMAQLCVVHSSSDPSGLTSSESRVLGMIARGHSNKVISDTFDVSPRTVEWHRNRLMQKLQARNVVQLMVRAVRKGLLDV